MLAVDFVATLCALPVLAFELMDAFAAMVHLLGQLAQLGIDFGTLHIELREFARQHHSQLRAHFF